MATTRDRQEILAALKASKPELLKAFPLRRMALFGSWARNEAAESSDVDILVEVDPSIGLGFVDLAEKLEDILGHPVDLVSLRSLKPGLLKHIETELIDV